MASIRGVIAGLLLAPALSLAAGATDPEVRDLEIRKVGGPAALILALGLSGDWGGRTKPCGDARLPGGSGVLHLDPDSMGCRSYDTFVVYVSAAPRPDSVTEGPLEWCQAIMTGDRRLMLEPTDDPDRMTCRLE